MNKLALALSTLFASAALAQAPAGGAPPDLSKLLSLLNGAEGVSTGEWKRFDTLHEAVVYEAGRLEQCSHYYECSSFFMKDPAGKIAVGPTRSDYASDHVSIRPNGPEDWTLLATIHSHPCIPNHYPNLFSPQDMMGSVMTKTTGYMVSLCTGDIHEFIPGKTPMDDVHLDDEDIWLSAGNIVGHVAALPDVAKADEGI